MATLEHGIPGWLTGDYASCESFSPAKNVNTLTAPPIEWPESQPTLETNRLILRPLAITDAGTIQTLAGEFSIADTTLNIVHPYPDGLAEEWISEQPAVFKRKQGITFGIALKNQGNLIGVASLGFTIRFQRGELGYWITPEFWNQGYATEAGVAVVRFGLGRLGLHKIAANHLRRNPPSGKVLRKIGFEEEGVLKDHVLKWNVFEDVVTYGCLSAK